MMRMPWPLSTGFATPDELQHRCKQASSLDCKAWTDAAADRSGLSDCVTSGSIPLLRRRTRIRQLASSITPSRCP